MELAFREIGAGNPIVILHGLYGSSDNWVSIGRELSSTHRVILVDLRNHGNSPHSSEHSYLLMVADLHELFSNLGLRQAILLGHSMGGKVAARFAWQYPQLLKGLVIADILPFESASEGGRSAEQQKTHEGILASLLNLNLENLSSRDQLDKALAISIPNRTLRLFLLKNLQRDGLGSFQWKINVEALAANLQNIMQSAFPPEMDGRVEVPTQFIMGEVSPYMDALGVDEIGSYFASFKVDVVLEAGHWLHAEKPLEFMYYLKRFLQETL